MSIKFNGVTIILNVKDIERTEEFYRKNLGISFDRYEGHEGSPFLMTKIGTEVDFMVFKGDPKPGNTPNVVFGLEDGGIDTLIERLAANGVEIVTPVSEAPDGWYTDFRDPDGHIISFYQAETAPRTLK